MSRYNYNNPSNAANSSNLYDPVGSQQNQPTGYTCGASTSSTSNYPSAATASYQSAPNTAAYQEYGSSYNSHQQQYPSNAQGTTGSTGRAATGLNGQENNAQSSATTASTSNTYDGSAWAGAGYGSYGTSNVQVPNRTQSNNSPLYATQATSSTFGRLSVPDQTQTQNPTSYAANYQGPQQTTATPSSATYQPSYSQPQNQGHTQAQTQATQQPQRYNSPLHAVQAQSANKQASRGASRQPSPQMAAVQAPTNRQHSASVEPAPTNMTVNLSQVYDDRAERQRKAQIEAEKRRKQEEEQAARKAEEDRIAAEKRKVDEEQQKAEKEAAMKKTEYERKAEQRKEPREEKKQSKSAATALQKMASSGGISAVLQEDGPPAKNEEAEMRAMFKKMREFNAKNPAMLAKLWEEERSTHSTSQSPPAAAKPSPIPAAAPATPTAKQQHAALNAVSSAKTGQPRPFAKPAPPKAPAQKLSTPIHAQASTSLWPPQKKGSLAEAAAKWLANLPDNLGEKVAREDVLKILESNPSYVQLCEALEALGLRFERSSLARELLKAVPDGMKAQVHQQPAAATPLPTANGAAPHANGASDTLKKRGRPKRDSAPATVGYEAPRFTSLSDGAREIYKTPSVPMGGPVQPPQPVMMPPSAPMQQPTMSGSRPASASQPPVEVKPEVKPEEPPRPPANKEEAARKRTFGDLVDLTAEESDDEAPPMKMVFPMVPCQPNGPPQQQQQASTPSSSDFTAPMNAQDFYKRPQLGATPGLEGFHVCAPWQATPRPNQPSLNPAVNQPAQARPQPPPQPHKPRGPTLEAQQMDRVRGNMLVEPIMRDRVARKSRYDPRTIARDVLLATGRHPDMRALNSHLNTIARVLGDHGGSFEIDGQRGNRSDLSTIRWDIIDPGEPRKPKVQTETEADAKTKPAVTAAEEAADADDGDDEPAATQTIRQATDTGNGDGTVSYVSVQQQLTGKPKKRRGRPARQSLPTTETVSFVNAAGERRRVTVGEQRATARPPAVSATAPTGVAVGYSALRQLDADGNIVKKKGRPFGWRKNVHSREAQGLTPPKAPRKSGGEKALVEARWEVWKCKWRECPAELHNLDTLKKHVIKVHGKGNEEGELECLWDGCEGGAPVGKGKGKATEDSVAVFPDMARWLEHIDKQHLQPIAWELGDGPRGGTSDHNAATDSEAYLSDAQGRSVTPVIRPETIAEATSRVVPAAVRRPARPTVEIAHMTKDERKAAGELAELEEHKKAVGWTMEKTGATFANKKRRQGFLDDEEFEDEIDTEGEHWEEPEGEE